VAAQLNEPSIMFSLTVVAAIAVVALVIGVLLGRDRSSKRTVVWSEGPRASRSGELSPGADAETDALLRRDRLIEAIKRHRELTGVGLKEAKEAMEARRRELR
jgi:ribosomal protein L7/L12